MISLVAFGLIQALIPSPLPFAMPADPRIQTVAYRPDQVVVLRAANGYATVIELAPDERIETVVLGDTTGWQVTPNRAGDRLVVKPLGLGGTTNMVVLTDARRYVFLLEATGDPAGTAFALSFSYAPAAASGFVQRRRMADYRLHGDRSLYPIAMSDDGARTTVTWDSVTPIPAIFAVDEKGRETLVNARMVDGDYMIEGTARRYVLRRGRDRATATRQALVVNP